MDLVIVIWTNIGIALAATVCGYIFGSIPFSLLIGKLIFHKDPREFGSKNLGASNSGRVLGKKVGMLVLVLDALKLAIPLWGFWAILYFTPLGNALEGSPLILEPIRSGGVSGDYSSVLQYYYLVALGCSLGHVFPLFAGLKGGKSVSCLAGLIFFTNWTIAIIAIIIFLTILCARRYVGLASICTAILTAGMSWLTLIPELSRFTFYGGLFVGGIEFATIVTIITGIIIIRHKSNIKRLLRNEEIRVNWLDFLDKKKKSLKNPE